MKRIHFQEYDASVTVADDCSQDVIEALKTMIRLAYTMKDETLSTTLGDGCIKCGLPKTMNPTTCHPICNCDTSLNLINTPVSPTTESVALHSLRKKSKNK